MVSMMLHTDTHRFKVSSMSQRRRKGASFWIENRLEYDWIGSTEYLHMSRTRDHRFSQRRQEDVNEAENTVLMVAFDLAQQL